MALQQNNPPHPGELIHRTYIEPYEGMSGNKIADKLGVARSTFSRLLTGKSGVSPDMAIRLSQVVGGSVESWLRLQESYDLWKARHTVDVKNLERIDFDQVA